MKKAILAAVVSACLMPCAQAGAVRLAAKATFHVAKFGVKATKATVKTAAKVVF